MSEKITVVTTVAKEHFEQYNAAFPESWEIRYVSNTSPDEELIKACSGADYLWVFAVDKLSRRVIENIPSVRYIQVEGVAYNRVDFDATTDQALPLCNTKGANALSVAEFTVGMMIMVQRRLIPTDRRIKEGDFLNCQTEYRSRGVKELRSAHVGIIGLGDIGRNLARMLKPFNCKKISYYDIARPREELEKELCVGYLPFEELLRQCDIITLHVPVTPDTVNMISTREIDMMKQDVMILNTARGEVLDQYALSKALEEGKVYGAGTDVLSPEPPPAEHPLLRLSPAASERMFITPHVAGTTDEAYENMISQAIQNIKNAVAGKELSNVVNGIHIPRNTRSTV